MLRLAPLARVVFSLEGVKATAGLALLTAMVGGAGFAAEEGISFGNASGKHRLNTWLPAPMHLLGIYSNHDLQGSLGRLVEKLAAVRGSGKPRRRPLSRRQRPRRPGWVLEAIVQVLADRGEPMHVKDIHAAVEALVGEPVPPPSVKGGPAKNVAGSSRRFVREGRGRYVLA